MYGLGPRQSSHTTGKSVFSQPSSSGSAFWRDACANEGGEGAGRGASGGAREIGGRTDAGRVDGTRRGGGTRQRDARTMRCACGLARRALQIRVGRSRGWGASSRVGSVFAHGRDGTHHGRFASRVFHEPWSRAGGRAMGARRGAGAVLAFFREDESYRFSILLRLNAHIRCARLQTPACRFEAAPAGDEIRKLRSSRPVLR